MATVISIEIGPAKLPGHVDIYDAIGVTEEFEEVGLYQHIHVPSWYFCGPLGIFVDTQKL